MTRRASRSTPLAARRGPARAAGARGLLDAVVVDSDDSRAVVRLVFEQQEAGAAARVQGRRRLRRSRGRSSSARRRRVSRPRSRATAIYAAAASGTIVRVDPATGSDGLADRRRQAPVGRSRRRRDAGRGRHRQGRRARLHRRRQAAVAGEGHERGRQPAEGRRRHRRRLVRRRPRCSGSRPPTARPSGCTSAAIRRSRSATIPAASISRGGLFIGTAGGKLLALDLATGNVGWEGNVATPKGATELERIADVTSLPVVDERQICAVAYQGRVACFEILRGTLNWSRDVSSLDGLAADSRYLYVTDDRRRRARARQDHRARRRGSRTSSRSAGRAARSSSASYVAVVDVEGYVHLLDRNDGSLVGRARDRRHAGDGAAGALGRQRPSGRAPAGRSFARRTAG